MTFSVAAAQQGNGQFNGYTLRVKLIGSVMYEPLYARILLWEK